MRNVLTAVAVLALVISRSGGALAHAPPADRVAEITETIDEGGEAAELYLERAEHHLEDARLDDARADLRRAAALAPGLPAVDLLWSLVHLAESRPGEALRALDRYLKAVPDSPTAYRLQAEAHAALGNPGAAARAYASVLRLASPPLPEDFLRRAGYLADAHDPGTAVACLDAGSTRLGFVPALELEALGLERGAGELDAAQARLGRLIARMGRLPFLLHRQGEIFADAGYLLEAAALWTEALDRLGRSRASFARTTLARDIRARLNTLNTSEDTR